MAGKFLDIINGAVTQVQALLTSAGAGSADGIPRLDAAGRLDLSFMPSGVGTDTASIIASEALVAGDFINIWDDAGVFKIRKSDATTAGKEVDGFVLAAVSAAASGEVHSQGENNQLAGLAVGATLYMSTTAGGVTSTPVTGSGNVSMPIGKATSATSMFFNRERPVTLA